MTDDLLLFPCGPDDRVYVVAVSGPWRAEGREDVNVLRTHRLRREGEDCRCLFCDTCRLPDHCAEVQMAPRSQRLGAALHFAASNGYHYAYIVGLEEAPLEAVRVKDLRTGEQWWAWWGSEETARHYPEAYCDGGADARREWADHLIALKC